MAARRERGPAAGERRSDNPNANGEHVISSFVQNGTLATVAERILIYLYGGVDRELTARR